MVYLQLFVEFFKTGLFAVGGGLATLPFLSQMADVYPWFDRAMLTKMVAVAESTPGSIGVNVATYAGFRAAGIPGSLVATFALVLPSVIVIVIVAKMLQKFRRNRLVDAAFYGLRPAVCGMIAAAALGVMEVALFRSGTTLLSSVNWVAVALFATLLYAMFRFKKHPVVYLAAAAIAGMVFQL